jgi:transcriptional regulator with XRE-family HTH domain
MGRTSAPPLNGKRVRQERLRLRLKQSEVCQACQERGFKLHAPMLSRIENGLLKWPDLKGIPVLAEVLGVSVDDLWDTEGDKPVTERAA